MKTNRLPKIYFHYTTKRGRYIYIKNPSSRKIARLLASDKFKISMLRGWLKVEYTRGIENEIKTDRAEDLKWALKAFLDKDLYL